MGKNMEDNDPLHSDALPADDGAWPGDLPSQKQLRQALLSAKDIHKLLAMLDRCRDTQKPIDVLSGKPVDAAVLERAVNDVRPLVPEFLRPAPLDPMPPRDGLLPSTIDAQSPDPDSSDATPTSESSCTPTTRVFLTLDPAVISVHKDLSFWSCVIVLCLCVVLSGLQNLCSLFVMFFVWLTGQQAGSGWVLPFAGFV